MGISQRPKAERGAVVRNLILALTYVLAFSIRLFTVVKHESVFHGYESHFNYRATKYLLEHGYEKFVNWFDDKSWYPLGRSVGGTIYPGLMYFTAQAYRLTSSIGLRLTLKDLCVYVSPFMAANTVLMVYLLAFEALRESSSKVLSSSGKSINTAKKQDTSRPQLVSVTAAAFMAIVPGFLSQTSAATYDNDSLAMFSSS